MNFVLLDDPGKWNDFLPLTFTRPLSEIRIGILTVKEKWERSLNSSCAYLTRDYLSEKYPSTAKGIFIYSHYCPDPVLAEAVRSLQPGEALYSNNEPVAFNGPLQELSSMMRKSHGPEVFRLNQIWDIFQKNAQAVKTDFELLTKGRTSQPLSDTITVIGDKKLVFLEDGAKMEACILNTSGGPIYLGRDAEMMEGCVVRGPLALCEHSTLKLSTKIYGATTIGPHCKVGGEVSNSVILGYSNKAHDGFLGNSVIGEWCNLGADTNNSNLKNNYGNVKLFNFGLNRQVDTGLQFCGLIMGDYSKAGINTMFNTGTVTGVGCNIYGGGFPPTVIPNFSWGGSEGFENYQLEKLFETAEKVMERRGLVFSDTDKAILRKIAEGV